MWIREVDVPSVLLDALRADNLVIFVGAGASVGTPANLPTFVKLATRIASDTHQTFDADEMDQHPDVVLGQLEDRGVDVHRLIKMIIGDPASAPNELHRAIAQLAAVSPRARVVATNYDLHLSTALRDLGIVFNEYRGPAVPMGDDFDGIVYLHGDLTQDPRHLIATEGDLGRAYLTDAWAARFVERMFARYTVLFIGYSHNDSVMRLIARGIGGARPQRYALTHQADRDVWKTYGVTPIKYEAVGYSHAALADALTGWAELTSMGLHDHRQRIARLVGAAPPLVPEEVSYLEDVLGDPDRVQFFCELAESPEWLSWAAQRPPFQALFRTDAPYDRCTVLLAGWFVERFVMDEARTAEAFAILQDAGGLPAPVLCATIGQCLHRRRGQRPAWLGLWLTVLIEHAGDEHTDWLEYALLNSTGPVDGAAALLLYDSLTEPRLRQRTIFAGAKPSFDINLRGSVRQLDEAWTKVFGPTLSQVAAAVVAIADRQLRRVSGLLTIAGTTRPGWDPVSFGRYAIERDDGDRFREPVDVLIDAARDGLAALLAAGSPAGPGHLDTWATSDAPILQRLALHGWTLRTDVDATAKLAWLRSTGWLFDLQLRPEVYRLIKDALPTASPSEADALVSDARTLPAAGRDDEHVAYQRFNALTWLTQVTPDLASARAALDELRTQYPHFKAREHPDLRRSRMEFGVVGEQPPMSVDELHERITADVAAAIIELRRYEDVKGPFNGPSWDDALQVLAATVHDHPADGFPVVELAGSLPSGMVSAVIHGWSAATLNQATAVAVIRSLRTLDLVTVTDSIAQLLIGGIAESANAPKWHLIPEARELAKTLWTVLGPVDPPYSGSDWVALAINRPAGHVADFWIRAVSADWAAAGDAWDGLPSDLRQPLETMLSGTDQPTWLAQTILASRLTFFFAADRPWCQRNLLPLMMWTGDEETAVRVWTGYLTADRVNDEVFQAGLSDAYLDTVDHAHQMPEDLSRVLLEHLAAIAVYSSTDPLSWAGKFTVRADEQQRTSWINDVGDTLAGLAPDAVEQQWQRWMRQYWQQRLNSVPTPLTTSEASALATWVPRLTMSFEAGVGLATAHRAGLNELHTLHDWSDDRLMQEPVLFARLLAHLLKGTTPPVWENLERVAVAVKAGAEPNDFAAIRDEALRLGFPDAANW